MWFVPEKWSGEPNQSDHNRVNNVYKLNQLT